MKTMRQLMESVSAIPGLGERRDLKFEQIQPGGAGGAEAQMQTAGTAARGADYAAFDASQGQATESAPPGEEKLVKSLKKEYPGHEDKAFATAWSIYNKKHGKTEESMEESVPAIDSCNQSNPANADAACAMEENVEQSQNYIEAQQRMSDLLSSFVDPQEAFDVISRELDEKGVEDAEFDEIMTALENQFFPDSESYADAHADADALASAGHGSDEDYGDHPMEEDLQNGYHDVNFASGRDYFPDGADSPVVDATGPSGARMGDNDEQKKMQVAETHKELVYSYRAFLKESARK